MENVLILNCSPVRNGATAEIVNLIFDHLKERYNVRSICIDDFDFGFCKGCRACHSTAKCVLQDDVGKIMEYKDSVEQRKDEIIGWLRCGGLVG